MMAIHMIIDTWFKYEHSYVFFKYVLYILLSPIIIMMQDCSQALSTCKSLQSLFSSDVSNMLLVLSITFHFITILYVFNWPFSVCVIERIYL